MTLQFAVGSTYATRSICDHTCTIAVTVARRTAKTVTGADGKVFRIGPYAIDGAEFIRPWGKYSMAPIVTAAQVRK